MCKLWRNLVLDILFTKSSRYVHVADRKDELAKVFGFFRDVEWARIIERNKIHNADCKCFNCASADGRKETGGQEMTPACLVNT